MEIRKARISELEEIEGIYENGRKIMKANQNPLQWGERYPSRQLILEDITRGDAYVCTEAGELLAVFAFIVGEDETYRAIEAGKWLNQAPYATLHRIASVSKKKGIADDIIRWSFEKCHNLRVDTHQDNQIMQHVLQKNGFVRCGIIYVADGTPRIAYQKALQGEA